MRRAALGCLLLANLVLLSWALGTEHGSLLAKPAATASRAAPLERLDDYGAVGDGVTDDGPAINAALSGGARILYAGAKTYRSKITITLPPGVNLAGAGYSDGMGATGTMIVCDANVSPCLRVGGRNLPNKVSGLTITHAGGRPAAPIIGIQVVDASQVALEDITSSNSGICYQFAAHPARETGLGAYLTRAFSGACSDAHIDIDSWPELRISQSRFGMNGPFDYAGTTYMRIRGGVPGTAGGPNTIIVTNTQFNQGHEAPAYFLQLVNLGGANIDAGLFHFDNVHVEGVSTAIITTDASWSDFPKTTISNCTFNTPKTPFWALHPNTRPTEVNLTDNQYYVSSFELAPPRGMTAFKVIGGLVAGKMSLVGTPTSMASIIGLTHLTDFDVSGPWRYLAIVADSYTAGHLNNTASGNIAVTDAAFDASSPASFGAVAASSLKVTGPDGIVAANPAPALSFRSTAAPPDRRNADIYEDDQGDWQFRACNAAFSACSTWAEVHRGAASSFERLQLGIPLGVASYTAAQLPKRAVAGTQVFCSDCRKPSEADGRGKGMVVFVDSDGQWFTMGGAPARR